MADTPDKAAQFGDKPSMPWFDTPELEAQWVQEAYRADQAALAAGAYPADVAIAHMRAAKDLLGWTNEQFAEFLLRKPSDA